MPEVRLGDVIDDFCVKCKRIMNHSVVSIVNSEPAKVRCRTCYNDHDYRHEQAPPPKTDTRKSALFNEVLSKMQPQTAAAAPADTVETDDGETELIEVDADETDSAEAEPAPAKTATARSSPIRPKHAARTKPKPAVKKARAKKPLAKKKK